MTKMDKLVLELFTKQANVLAEFLWMDKESEVCEKFTQSVEKQRQAEMLDLENSYIKKSEKIMERAIERLEDIPRQVREYVEKNEDKYRFTLALATKYNPGVGVMFSLDFDTIPTMEDLIKGCVKHTIPTKEDGRPDSHIHLYKTLDDTSDEMYHILISSIYTKLVGNMKAEINSPSGYIWKFYLGKKI